MQKIYILLCILSFQLNLFAQNSLRTVIRNNKTKELLPGASVFISGIKLRAIANDNGFAEINGIPNGKFNIAINSLSFKEKETNLIFPHFDTLFVFLDPVPEDLEEVKVVSSTRSSRNIKDIPTRIEGIPLADLEEKSVMQPGNIKMLVSEIAGVQTQQTSQVSGSASLRIQGLDGKYTQLLQDGLPLYSGFASGLSVLQIPPLNLKRVEVIKGSNSTLYGGGAIAGLINLITKEPTDQREISFLVNANQTKALDLSGFYSEKYKKTGLTIYAASNLQKAFDANKDGFSDLPKFNRFTFSPKFFYYPNANTTFSFGVNTSIENRIGGDMQVINHGANALHAYFEADTTNRFSTQAKFEKTYSNKNILTIKNSIGFFDRTITRPGYNFGGKQVSSFSEINYLIPNKISEWNFGATFYSDNFNQNNVSINNLSYSNNALGIFAQNNLKVSEKFFIESGFRLDKTNDNKFFPLPRLSLLYKITHKLTTRIGGGLGYKTPTIFSEEAEEIAFQNIAPLNYGKLSSEKSYGVNADLNYKTVIFDDVHFSFNQMFFYTQINSPLMLDSVAGTNNFIFENANGNIISKGFETSIKLQIEDLSCFIGFTFNDVSRNFNHVSTFSPLTAKHHLDFDLLYDIQEKLQVGYELFYVGPQTLSNHQTVRDYWVTGFSSEYKFKHFSLFLNLENFTDTRQSKWESMYSGSNQNPVFREVYTPTEGFVLNGGFKIKF